ncbi:MAG: hypothetical protein ACYDD6_07800, partial [Acidimicrobiales bacterium]
ESYLEFDVSAIPVGSTILSFVVSLPVDPSAPAEIPTATAPPIIACTPQGAWSGGGQGGQPFSGKPSDQCATNAPKFTSNDGGKTYSADITSIAQNWLQPGVINNGVAVADDPSNSQTAYQVAFGPAQSITQLTASVSYVPATSTSTTATGTVGSSGGSPVSSVVPNIPSGSVFVAPSAPSVDLPFAAVPTASTPSVTPPTHTGRRAALEHAALAGAGSIPPGGFWVVGVLLLALLLSISLVLGDETVPFSPRRRQRIGALGTLQRTASSSTGAT